MLGGRVVWGIVSFVLLKLSGSAFTGEGLHWQALSSTRCRHHPSDCDHPADRAGVAACQPHEPWSRLIPAEAMS
jgi:hypothetical protein